MISLTSPLVAAVAAAAMPTAASLAEASHAPTAPSQAQEEPAAEPEIPDCGDMTMLPSGLRYCVLKDGGDGPSPLMGDQVRVDYTGWNLDGSIFDSSRRPRRPGLEPEPAEFAVGGLIEGWNEALQLMSPGDQWKLYVPAALGYGVKGSPPNIAPNADLIFEVELHAILDSPPRYVAWDAEAEGIETSAEGVEMRVLQAGEGKSIEESDFGLVRFSCYSPEGAFVLAHTTQGGPLMVSKQRAPLPFMGSAVPQLRKGALVQLKVPSAFGIGKRAGGSIPNLPEGSDEIWMLECQDAFKFEKPEFRLPADAELTTTESGLKYVIVREGEGQAPEATNSVVAHYAGWLTDGKAFDNSYDRGEPSTFGLQQVIRGWTEGLQLLKPGGAGIFVIPGELGYGERGSGDRIPPNATLVFYVELVQVN